MKTKFTLTAFIVLLLIISSLGIVKANRAIDKTKNIEESTSSSKLDSIISRKIDYRYTSYDGRFMYDNMVVIDSNNIVIGRLILYTTEKEIDSFYNSDIDWKKTRLFTNLKNGKLRILPKE